MKTVPDWRKDSQVSAHFAWGLVFECIELCPQEALFDVLIQDEKLDLLGSRDIDIVVTPKDAGFSDVGDDRLDRLPRNRTELAPCASDQTLTLLGREQFLLDGGEDANATDEKGIANEGHADILWSAPMLLALKPSGSRRNFGFDLPLCRKTHVACDYNCIRVVCFVTPITKEV